MIRKHAHERQRGKRTFGHNSPKAHEHPEYSADPTPNTHKHTLLNTCFVRTDPARTYKRRTRIITNCLRTRLCSFSAVLVVYVLSSDPYRLANAKFASCFFFFLSSSLVSVLSLVAAKSHAHQTNQQSFTHISRLPRSLQWPYYKYYCFDFGRIYMCMQRYVCDKKNPRLFVSHCCFCGCIRGVSTRNMNCVQCAVRSMLPHPSTVTCE